MIRDIVKNYAETLLLAVKKAIDLPKNVEGEQMGYACYISTPGERKVEKLWHEIWEKCFPDANSEELFLLIKSILPLYWEDKTFRGRTGSCGDYETIDCPLKSIYNRAWYDIELCIKEFPFPEMQKVPDAWNKAAFPEYITKYKDEYNLLPSQYWVDENEIDYLDAAQFSLNLLMKRNPKYPVKIDRIYSKMNKSSKPLFEKYAVDLNKIIKEKQDFWDMETVMDMTLKIFQRSSEAIGSDIIERYINSKLFYNETLKKIIPQNLNFYTIMQDHPFSSELLLSLPDDRLIKKMAPFWDKPGMDLITRTGDRYDIYYLARLLYLIAGYRDLSYKFIFNSIILFIKKTGNKNGKSICNAIETIFNECGQTFVHILQDGQNLPEDGEAFLRLRDKFIHLLEEYSLKGDDPDRHL